MGFHFINHRYFYDSLLASDGLTLSTNLWRDKRNENKSPIDTQFFWSFELNAKLYRYRRKVQLLLTELSEFITSLKLVSTKTTIKNNISLWVIFIFSQGSFVQAFGIRSRNFSCKDFFNVKCEIFFEWCRCYQKIYFVGLFFANKINLLTSLLRQTYGPIKVVWNHKKKFIFFVDPFTPFKS